MRALRTLAGQPRMGTVRSVRAICARTALGTRGHWRSWRAYRGLRSRISASADRTVSVEGSGRETSSSPARKVKYMSWAAVASLAFTGVLLVGGDVSGAQEGPGSRPVGSRSVLKAVVVVVVVAVALLARVF